MRELSVITYPHLRILPITSADNPRNISPQFTRLNIRTSAGPHIRILPEAFLLYSRNRGELFSFINNGVSIRVKVQPTKITCWSVLPYSRLTDCCE